MGLAEIGLAQLRGPGLREALVVPHPALPELEGVARGTQEGCAGTHDLGM